jgi:hypothetical protein
MSYGLLKQTLIFDIKQVLISKIMVRLNKECYLNSIRVLWNQEIDSSIISLRILSKIKEQCLIIYPIYIF